MDTACVSESLKMPATACGKCNVVLLGVLGVPGVPGVEKPVSVVGAAPSMAER